MGLCCGLFSFPFSIAAIVMGVFGMRSEQGRVMGIAGTVLGVLALLLMVVTIIFSVAFNVANFGAQNRGRNFGPQQNFAPNPPPPNPPFRRR
ncbi:hypothetical protein FRUB_03146 [Fimbriiglobus ruber]|uniref:DUF4190 domain-containing protein n=1 Tax=Fimbriiglobus ruber TaxID=1908690 RepID=A0A225E553_9BACT|nr:hypothetical protein FRUB_03146 [Fimbriiglobus ruber]